MGEKIGLEVDTGKSQVAIDKTVMSTKQLTTEMKAAKTAALNGDSNAAKKVAELKDRIDDLKDATKSLQGSGIEKTQTSFGLLGEGLMTLDWDKIKTGFAGLSGAIKAIPLFFLIEGIKYVVENFDKLSQGNGLLAKSLRVVGKAFEYVKEFLGIVADYFSKLVGASTDASIALDKMGEAITKSIKKSTDALKEQTGEYDHQIAVAKAAGKESVELEVAKQKAIMYTNLVIAKQIEAYVKAGGEFTEEKKKQLTAALEGLKAAHDQTEVLLVADYKKKQDLYKAHIDAKKKLDQDAFNEALAEQQKEEDYRTAENVKKVAEAKKEEADLKATRDKALIDLKAMRYKADLDEIAEFNDKEQKKKAIVKATEDANKNTRAQALQAAHALDDVFFMIQQNRAKGNNAQLAKLAKEKFIADKVFNAAQATMDGFRAVTGTLASTASLGPWISIPASIATGALAFANVAKILATPFTGGGDTSVASAPTLPSANTGTPTINNASNTPAPQAQTNLDANGNNLNFNVQANISEHQVTSVQDRILRLKRQASN